MADARIAEEKRHFFINVSVTDLDALLGAVGLRTAA
jgi:hypothetical protein